MPLRVDGVVATAEGDDASPCDREAVCLDAVLLQEGDVFLPARIRVGRDVAIAAVEGFARRPAEVVPDGFSATINVRRAPRSGMRLYTTISCLKRGGDRKRGLTGGEAPEKVLAKLRSAAF